MSLCIRHNCPGLKCQGRGVGCPVEMPKERKILLGVLGDPRSDMRIGFVDQCWTLATGEGDSYEVLCRHEDFNQFLELVNEYSDYVDGE